MWVSSIPEGLDETDLDLNLGMGPVEDVCVLACESNMSRRLDTLPDTLRGGGRRDALRIGELSCELIPDL